MTFRAEWIIFGDVLGAQVRGLGLSASHQKSTEFGILEITARKNKARRILPDTAKVYSFRGSATPYRSHPFVVLDSIAYLESLKGDDTSRFG